MLVKQVMGNPVAFANQFDTLQGVAIAMKRSRLDSIPVAENEPPHAYIGMITHRDLVHAMAQRVSPETQVTELLKNQRVFVRPGDPIEKALEIMQRKGLKDIAVIDDERSLVGVVVLSKVARFAKADGAKPKTSIAAIKGGRAQPGAHRAPSASSVLKRTGR